MVHVQEAHGSQAGVDKFCALLKRKFWIEHSFLPTAVGGILSLVSKTWVRNRSSISFAALAQGRVGRLSVLGERSQHISWNVHNYGITRDVLAGICTTLNSDVEMGHNDPLKFCVTLTGISTFLPLCRNGFPTLTPCMLTP